MFDAKTILTHTDELSRETFAWGELVWLCNARLLPGAAQTLGICQIRPRQKNPPHYHPNCEEVLYVQSGHGRHSFNEHWLDLKAGHTIRVPAGVHHQLVNEADEPLVCVIAFSSADRQTVFLD